MPHDLSNIVCLFTTHMILLGLKQESPILFYSEFNNNNYMQIPFNMSTVYYVTKGTVVNNTITLC